MKKFLTVLLIISAVIVTVTAQQTADEKKAQDERNQADFNQRVDALRNVGKPRTRVDPNEEFHIMQSRIKPRYRKPNDNEIKLLAPENQDLQTFSDFLSNKNTGITKLIIDKGCDQGSEIVNSTPHCLKYAMPGAGASYSFRVKNYQNKSLGDLNFSGDVFETTGVLKQGILINIGDISLDKINLDTKELKVLAEFIPPDNFKKASAFSAMLEKGIDGGEFVYKNSAPVLENTTYALRSIAYRGEVNQVVDGISYNELSFDERRDVIVVFRIVRLVPDESVTILWKELSDKKSPKIDID